MKTTFKVPEIKALYDLGFAIHWLKPNSKVPVESGWTTGPRQDFAHLRKTYRKDFNVGVRLGGASKLKSGEYLAVVDLDIKSDKPAHRKEAEARLFEIFPEAKIAPCVLSGRGNGSAHYYVALKTPVRGEERKGQSQDFVKLNMPSVEPSKKELTKLTPEELSSGIRIRAAWEISLLSEGRQVVLPGSVHPDTARHYVWNEKASPLHKKIPCLTNPAGKSGASNLQSATLPDSPLPFERHAFQAVNVRALGLRPEQVAMIETGGGVEDRSAACFSLCMALLQRKISDIQIISLLTDKTHWLGATAFDHAKTTDRNRAAYWLKKYCLAKAREKVAGLVFESEVEELADGQESSSSTRNTEAVATANGLMLDLEWQRELDIQRGPAGSVPTLRPTFKNVVLILQNEISFELLKHDLFANEDTWAANTPWGYEEGRKRSGNNKDALRVKKWLIQTYQVECSVNVIEEALSYIADSNAFHPVKDFLEELEWDGVERVEKAFFTYLGARMPKTYQRACSRKFFQALIARIYDPGCKFDHMPVLEGIQGVGKSTFGRILVGDHWFMDGLPDLSDKDAALNLQGIWLCELSELASLYRSANEQAKAFIARQVDKLRPPYGHRRVDFPRSSVFLGTTNSRDYLSDPTGNRRFWPHAISGCNFKKLKKDRLQLLAEAKFNYDFNPEPLYLDDPKAKHQAEIIQESRRIEDEADSMAVKFDEWCSRPVAERQGLDINSIQIDELFDAGPFQTFQKNRANRLQAALVLRKAGFQKLHTRTGKRWMPLSYAKVTKN